jgi:hypothetical protein
MPRVDLLSDAEREPGRVAKGRRRRRRTRAAVAAGALGLVVVLTGAVALASMVTHSDSPRAESESAAPVGTSPSPVPTASVAPSALPSPTVSPSARPKPRTTQRTPAPVRVYPSVPVAVLNNSTIRGLAARSADRVRNVGFTVRAVGNLYGNVERTTVYYRPGHLTQGNLLAGSLRGLQAVRPAPSWLPGTTPLTLVVTADFAD